MTKPLLCLMGPTASGKTALALSLAESFNFEIISVDSALIYQGMDIGTAKPTTDELNLIPHHLINILPPTATYSVANFCKDVEVCVDKIQKKGKRPLLVGGTMMYYQALAQGLSSLPSTDPHVRENLLLRLEQQGLASLYETLQIIDPKTAERLHANDTQRILRAIEVYESTQIPLSVHLMQSMQKGRACENLILMPEVRSWLHERIAQRFHMMIKDGFIDEVQHLVECFAIDERYPAMRSVGYRQALDFLKGQCDKATFIEKGIVATRQLAKRQLTWLRHWPQGHLFACDDLQSPGKITAFVAKFIAQENEH